MIDFLRSFPVLTNSKVRKNHGTCGSHINNDYANGDIEFKTQN